ncbi:aminotransferase [Microbulbifer marinus]|uniref:L-2,4-diaminobutyrate transaminase n=1 Tax=Microbulbifer marinus TaxID=658218 RepID=A0A1H4B3W2_9GAMM|nr:aminotransferase [Microbulbifer marinus]SEA42875.1 L-2,4-diaminobutyrate transaminase [Microbulbifer marinus]
MSKKFDPSLSLEELDRRTIFHASTPLKHHASGELGSPRIIDSGSGIRITDTKGVSTIDAFAGLYCVNVGYGRTEIADAIHEQAKKLAYYHTYVGHSNQPLIELSRRVIEMAPEGMSKIYYGMSGSDANETNIKLVWHYWNVKNQPRKRKIISRMRGYHGSGIMTGSMTGLPAFHTSFNLPMDDIKHTVAPHFYWEAEAGMSEREFSRFCADQLERKILEENPETIAAFIGEPVLGTGGIVPPPEGYWEEIQAVLAKYDILLIADEVVCGFGRVGHNFGSDRYGIKPDIMTVAKGLTSGYLPLSGSIVGEKVWSVLEDGTDKYGPIGHGWTYSGHALGAAAALANLDIIEKEDLITNTNVVGEYFQAKMHEAFDNHPLVGEYRGVALLGAIEFVADKDARQRFAPDLKVGPRISAQALKNGMIARAMPHQDTLGFAPPMVTTKDEVDEIVAIAEQSVNEVMDQLFKEGAWKG